jgi:uncharacterized GH25 family protein
MRRWCSALAVLAAVAVPARAHFIWIVPERGKERDKSTAQVVFSEDLKPDSNIPINKIAQTELFLLDNTATAAPLKWAEGKGAYRVSVSGKGSQFVAGVCRYGVLTRGEGGPFLLMYYPKAYLNWPVKDGNTRGIFHNGWDRLALEILPVQKGGEPVFEVRWHGKPLAGAEVVVLTPGEEKGADYKTDREGRFTITQEPQPGVFGIRAKHVEAKEGELDGKKYKEVRHYATLTFRLRGPDEGDRPPPPAKPTALKADPEATRLLADARAARANWNDFPGFTADLEVNIDGKVSRGRVEVSARGKVKLDLGDEAAAAWARRLLASVVAHRTDNSADLQTPCAFADANADHPLGRAIRVLNDEFHSSYRIRDRQVIVVNRHMKDTRFTITVLENALNEEKQFLPVSYVVNTWDLKADVLKRSEAHHQTWRRIGKFDLPLSETVVTAADGTLEARSMKLSNHKLLR